MAAFNKAAILIYDTLKAPFIMTESIIPTYTRLDIAFHKGKGVWLYGDDDKVYLDALSGIAVCNIGHSHPALTEALSDQVATLTHTSNLYHIPLQAKLAKKLCDLSSMDQAFFCNSGAEANETAIKIARKYGHQKQIDKPVIIVADSAFHGRTMATLTATGNTKVHDGFTPLLSGFVRIPYNDIDALKLAIGHWPEAVAVMLEPIQGEGGIKIPDSDYLPAVRKLCDQRHLLMMIDEVQTGIGRTGHWFAHQASDDVTPDVMMLAKGLANGIPIGACLVSNMATGVLQPGNHGSTFGGNPLACRAALTVLDVIEANSLRAHVNEVSHLIEQGFIDALSSYPEIKIRVKGMMIGIELPIKCTELPQLALEKSILINVTADRVVRLLPPLIMTQHEASQMITRVSELITEFMHNHAITEEQ